MKKLINHRDRIVSDMIDGYVSAFPTLVARGSHPRVVRRATPKAKDKVGLLIGNGSGHEPIAMGFVGEGVLDVNVVGDIFTAPPAEVILEGIREVSGEAGAILLISRHEGDVINGNGAVMLAEDEGLSVRALLMYDDVSSAPKGEEDQRRGAPGTMFIYKILGAAAEEGMPLEQLFALGEAVRDNTRTLAAAVAPGISPLTGETMFTLPEDEIFIGMGVHGEPGVGRHKVGPVGELVSHMMDVILDDRPIDAGTPTVILVNGAGGTTQMELLTVYRESANYLDNFGINAVSPMIGSFVTTQEMSGVSISLFTPTEDMLRLWRAPSNTPYFPTIHNSGSA